MDYDIITSIVGLLRNSGSYVVYQNSTENISPQPDAPYIVYKVVDHQAEYCLEGKANDIYTLAFLFVGHDSDEVWAMKSETENLLVGNGIYATMDHGEAGEDEQRTQLYLLDTLFTLRVPVASTFSSDAVGGLLPDYTGSFMDHVGDFMVFGTKNMTFAPSEHLHVVDGNVVVANDLIVEGNISGSVQTASYSTSASYAPTKAGVISSSAQVDYNSIQNLPTIPPEYVPPAGLISASAQVDYTDIQNKPSIPPAYTPPDGLVSSSAQVLVGSNVYSSSAQITFPQTASYALQALTASYVVGGSSTGDWPEITNKPAGLVSSSAQVDYTGIQNKPTTIETASYVAYANVANKPSGIVSSSAQVLNGSGVYSSSAQITFPTTVETASYYGGTLPYANITSKPTLFSASAQVDYTGIQNKPTIPPEYTPPAGLVSSSAQVLNGSGVYSASAQITFPATGAYALQALTASYALSAPGGSGPTDWPDITNKPAGLVSSSAQVFFGSSVFSSSAQITSAVSSASYAITASYVMPTTNDFCNDMVFMEHWLGTSTAGSNVWTATQISASAASALQNGEYDAPGIIQMTTGTTALGRAALSTGALNWHLSYGYYTLVMRVRIPTLSDGTNTFKIYAGWGDQPAAGDMVDGLYFLYDSTVSANWRICSAANSVRTQTTTSTAVAANAWITLKIVSDGSGQAEYFVNGTSVGTVTTNLPTGASRVCGILMKIEKSVGATARTFRNDWVRAYYSYRP